jgi:alkylhydroperoxidase family enzyme
MRAGLTEADVEAALGDLDVPTLPPAARAALRLADRLTEPRPTVDETFYAELRRHFDEGQILALGAALSVASGWQRFIEAFGIRPDGWTEGGGARPYVRDAGAASDRSDRAPSSPAESRPT